MNRRSSVSSVFRSSVPLLLVITLAGQGALPDASAQSADEVISAVKTRLGDARAISADFEQTFSSEYIDQTETTSGTILLKGDMYRVETATQLFVTDGKITWIYNRPENQVLINNYVVDETTFSLSRFLFDFNDRYYVSEMQAAPSANGTYRIELRAMDPGAFFPAVTLTVNKKDYVITGLDVVDANETRIKIALKNVNMNPVVSSDSFTFLPPENTEIVDLRS